MSKLNASEILTAMDAVWETSEITSNRKLVLLRLVTLMDDRSCLVSVPVSRISADTGIVDRTVRYCLRDLESLGLVDVVEAEPGDQNTYRVNLKGFTEVGET